MEHNSSTSPNDSSLNGSPDHAPDDSPDNGVNPGHSAGAAAPGTGGTGTAGISGASDALGHIVAPHGASAPRDTSASSPRRPMHAASSDWTEDDIRHDIEDHEGHEDAGDRASSDDMPDVEPDHLVYSTSTPDESSGHHAGRHARQPLPGEEQWPVSWDESYRQAVEEERREATAAAESPTPAIGLSDEERALADELSHAHPTGAAAMRRPPKIPLAPAKRLQAKFNPLADWANYVVVFLGGTVGTALRYWLWVLIPSAVGDGSLTMAFHPATFVANMIACFLFAAITTFCAVAIWIRKRTRQLLSRCLGMGMCGGLSTLSAMMVEDITALHSGLYGGFLLYTALSFLCGMLVSWAASALVMKLSAGRAARAMTEVTPDRVAKPAIGVRVPVDPEVAAAGSAPGTISVVPMTPEGEATPHVPAGFAAGDEPQPSTDEIPVVRNQHTGEVKL
ncbi:fluoride efflux transporter FluC [Bifidobacterium choloepi]|uniref:Fluoride-specific ion channel FluC n=1 Tax=Bifidobacterium choloepi TaxID=2614131 RepID=A0A6I5NMD5_9BIFI|nr:CrcB family protein [Bifidobacterium choloepi]NEG69902.1 CrcB family protein [Bifidobacterium choloepi]